jgi:hypothetical protein
MTEINTFSSAVDDAIARSGRPDRRSDIIAFVRTTIRECQVRSYFRNDMIEDSLIADGNVFIWNYPQEFRMLRTVRYPWTNQRGEFIYPPEILPGRNQQGQDYYYYGGPGYFVFSGLQAGVSISVSYYKNSKKLPYFETASRPATFSLETDSWTYLTATTDAEKLSARELVSNWLLFNYYDLIIEGTLAKVFKIVGDSRASPSYALYKSLQNDLTANEPSDSLNK